MNTLKQGWCENRIPMSASHSGGIYQISRPNAWTYVGAIDALGKIQEKYAGNVENLLGGGSWHNQPGERFRSIHHRIAEAYQQGVKVVIDSLAVEDDKKRRNQLKREFVASRRLEQKQGGLRVLNGESRPTQST